MKLKHLERLLKLEKMFPNKLQATTEWLERQSIEDLAELSIYLFASRAWLDKEAPREIIFPDGAMKLDEVVPIGNESPAMAICRHYGLDYRRTLELVKQFDELT